MDLTPYLSPTAVVLTGLISSYFIIRQLRQNAEHFSQNSTTIMGTTALSLERDFRTGFSHTFRAIERGEFENFLLGAITSDQLAEYEQYLDFFNTVGVLVKSGSLDQDIFFDLFPYRFYRVRTIKLTDDILKINRKAWAGLDYLIDLSHQPNRKDLMHAMEAGRKARSLSNQLAAPQPIEG